MEVVRTRAVEAANGPSPQPQVDTDILPSPPAPFPVELLAGRQQTLPLEQIDDAYAILAPVQQSCIDVLSSIIPDSPLLSSDSQPLSHHDGQLASALTELLDVCYELEQLQPSLQDAQDSSPQSGTVTPTISKVEEPYRNLSQHVTELQKAARLRLTVEPASVPGPSRLHPAVGVVREGLAWARVDALTHAILELVKSRPSILVDTQDGLLPPSYSQHDQHPNFADRHLPPDYDLESSEPRPLISEKNRGKEPSHITDISTPHVSTSGEKMMLEFDAVTDAIERLNAVAPRLQDQRVEMKAKSGLTRAEVRARMEKDKMRELEEIWDRIEKAHGKRRMVENGQRVDAEEIEARRAARRGRFFESLLDQSEATRLDDQDSTVGIVDADLARARDLRERDHFLRDLVEQSAEGRLANQDADGPVTDSELKDDVLISNLMEYSSSGRLHGQDSLPPTPRTKEPYVEDPMELVTMEDFFKGAQASQSSSVSEWGRRARSNSLPLNSMDEDEQKRQPGTLRKLAGMVRRGSLGLGLRANVVPDMTTLTYVAEHQENLRAVQIMLHGVGLSAKDDMAVETTSSRSGMGVDQAVIISKRNLSTQLRITLPTPVIADQSRPLVSQDLHFETKISALPTAATASITSLNTLLTHALSASDLRRLRSKALCCTECDREIVDLTKILRQEDTMSGSGFKDLPSEHWAEMMEVWMCHDDPGFTAHLAQKTKDGFWPTNNTVLVGGSYVLVGGNNVKRSNLNMVDSTATSWQVLSCACGEVLGKTRGNDGKSGTGTVRLSKWAIALLRNEDEEGESIEPLRFPLSVFIVSDMLELAQAHASYRFEVSDEETGDRRLLLWLFNPSIRISYRKAVGSPIPSPSRQSNSRRSSIVTKTASLSSTVDKGPVVKNIRAAKIMYTIVDSPGFSDDALPGFGPGGQIEQLTYPDEVCLRLITTLRESNTVYPLSRRTMGGFDVGFLERF